MAIRHQSNGPMGQYTPLHLNALSLPVNTTSSAISATGSQTVTPGSMAGIVVGMILHFTAGGGTAEDVVVTAVTSTTFTAVFTSTHTLGTPITTPTYLQYIPVGRTVSTSSPTSITAGSNVVITPVSLIGFYIGQRINISGGTGTAEEVQVSAINQAAGTVTFASVANNHSGNYLLTSKNGTFVGKLVVNQPGSSITITLYNGSPNLSPLPTNTAGGQPQGIIAAIQPSAAGQSFEFECACDWGLFYTVTGTTAGDYTLQYCDMLG